MTRTTLAARALLLIVALTALSGCAQGTRGNAERGAAAVAPAGTTSGAAERVAAEGGSYTSTGPAQLAAMLKDKNFLLVNVHIPYEGEISGTDLLIPYDQIESRRAELPPDKGARIFLYCRSGRMSAIAAQALVKLGYTDVWDLKGGMVAWEQAGNAIVERK